MIGSAPVEADGSALFQVPSRSVALFPGPGRTGPSRADVRSLTYVQAGETLSCARLPRESGDRAKAAAPLA